MTKILMPLTLALAALPAAADEPLQRLAELSRDIETRVHAQLGAEGWQFAGRELQGERVVKGAPYCATAVHESVQALTDGNRIVKTQRTELCRDGEGRTRREVQRDGAPRLVYLHDPVARESWVLQPDTKSARRLRGGGMVEHEIRMQGLGERLRDNAERWREWAAEASKQAREGAREAQKAAEQARKDAAEARKDAARAGAEPAIVVHEDVLIRSGSGEPQRHRDVRVIRLSDMPAHAPLPPLPPTPPVPPVPALHWTPGLPPALRDGGVTAALPAREIEGVKVNGERTTWTIEAGKIGNEKPIVISREVWKSPELMLTVLSRDADPRSGETSYRLEKIRRGEPDAALMKVPADYQQEPVRMPALPKAPAAPVAPKPPVKG